MANPIWAPGVNGPELPNTARVRDYWLGGTHNTDADLELADHLVSAAPNLPYLVRTHRAFLRRVVTRLAKAGVRQFIDLGSGLPTAGNVHEVAPDARVAYVEIDPAVAAEGQQILGNNPAVEMLCADLCDVHQVLNSITVLDMSEPVAVLLLDVLHFVPESAEPAKVIATYMDACVPGSHLAVSHTCRDPFMLSAVGLFSAMYPDPLPPFTFRYRQEVEGFFEGLEVLAPGVVPIPMWEPDPADDQDRNPENFEGLGGVARKH
ncbi:SAM-dependent methyltransferase [Lentzea tibetensis]|uniref:SAM-dependent methyltransferase n=1 Tax=Lentzea tibetensis TaxID=2591470 RepID=UPI0016479C0D|nr:SAM-dependent methyltransferase [Lentzea tibetensis]